MMIDEVETAASSTGVLSLEDASNYALAPVHRHRTPSRILLENEVDKLRQELEEARSLIDQQNRELDRFQGVVEEKEEAAKEK